MDKRMNRTLGYGLLVTWLALVACKKESGASPTPSAGTPSGSAALPSVPAAPAAKGERGTPAEAKSMLQAAVEHLGKVGRKQALADFNAKKAPFFDRDLYVFCADPNGILLANGGYPQYVGTSLDNLKDADGKSLGKAIRDAATPNTPGSVEYRWLNPVSNKTEPKISFVQKIDTDLCGVGAYNPR